MKRATEIPKIRFSGHENEWKQIRLGDVLKISRGASPRPIDNFLTDDINGVNWIKIGDVKSSESFITNTMQRITHEGALKSHKVKKGDLILSNSMSFGRPYILEIDGCIHDGWLHLENFENTFNRDFLQIYLGLNQVKAKYEKMSAGGVVQNLNSEIVRNLVLSVPSILEQEKIASFIMIIGDRIQTQEQIIENLEQLKKGYMQKIFSQQLRFKDENGVDFPEWEDIQLGELGQFYNGLSGKSKEHFVNGSHPYISYMEVFSNSILHNTANNMVKIFDNEFQNKVSFGDVLFTQSSETLDEIGMSSVWLNRDFEPYLNSFCFGLRINQEIAYPSFMGYLLRTMDTRQKIIKEGQGITRVNISSNRLRNINILLPSLDEQRKIATFFMLQDEKMAIERTKLLKLNELKLGYLQQMFV